MKTYSELFERIEERI